MKGLAHRERLLFELDLVRKELADEILRFAPEELDWEPRPGMKSWRAHVREIATTELYYTRWLIQQVEIDWDATSAAFACQDDPNVALQELERVRAETVGYLKSRTEEDLQTPVPVPIAVRDYLGRAEIEPEELIREITRHEYYHLAQLITYRWLLGDNPYRRG